MTIVTEKINLTPELKKEAEKLMLRYPDKTAALIPVLHLVQGKFGFVSVELEEQVAELMGLSRTRVHGVLTFYTMFNRKPVGKYLVQVCTNISCTLNGAEETLKKVKQKLGIGVGETTTDNKFTLMTVECLGSCGTAPVMQINDDYYENLTEQKIDEIFDKLN
ncbi:MAG: NADH-quinone oxidoreductase subunit NuoE [bacterium]